LPRAIIALHQNTDGVAASFFREFARRSADAAFEAVTNHSGAPADCTLFHGAGVRGIVSISMTEVGAAASVTVGAF